MESLQEKIDNLHPWFDDMKNPANGVSIHDVIEHNGQTYVLWSDKKGYSVSHRAYDGHHQGVSGTYKSLLKCFQCIPEYEG